MSEEKVTAEEGGDSLQKLQEELHRLRQEERQVEEQIAHLQAEISRSRGQERRRAQVNRSAALPALQVQRQRLRAELFRLEQDIRALREQQEAK
jgi:peptidoglycan hydrolase CwlO-like protein